MAVSHVKSDTIADFTGTFTGFNSQGSTTTIAATDIVRPSDWNSAHNMFYTLTGNTTGNSTASGTDVLFAGSGGISVGGSTGTIVISGPTQFTGSLFEPEVYGVTAGLSEANGTAYFRPFYLQGYYGCNRVELFQWHSTQSATTWFASGSVSSQTSSTAQGTWGQSGTYGLFSRKNTNQTNADFSNILSFKSGTYTYSYGVTQSASWSTNASSATVSVTTGGNAGFLDAIDTAGGITTSTFSTTGSTTFSSTSTNQNSFSSSFTNSFGSQNFSGVRPVHLGFASFVLTPGDYWLMHIQSTNSGSTGNSRLDRLAAQMDGGMIVYTTSNQSVLSQGSTQTIGTTNFKFGIGSHSASSNSTTTMALTAITLLASNASRYFMIHGNTL